MLLPEAANAIDLRFTRVGLAVSRLLFDPVELLEEPERLWTERDLAGPEAARSLANARFSVPQRLARWLVMIHDRIRTSTFTITHEYLSVILGVRRATITEYLHVLEGSRFIKSTRGVVRIINRDGLITATGGSYGPPEAAYKRLFVKGCTTVPS